MESRLARRRLLVGAALFLAASALVALDQWTKVLAATRLAGRGTVRLLGDFAVLVYINNRGAFLSLGSGLPELLRNVFLIALPLAAIPFLAWALLKKGIGGTLGEGGAGDVGWAEYSAAVLVVAGGVGNLIDRIFRGEVRDFLNFGIGRLRTGIMNLADLYILFALIVIAAALTSRSLRARRAARGGGEGADGPAEPGASGGQGGTTP